MDCFGESLRTSPSSDKLSSLSLNSISAYDRMFPSALDEPPSRSLELLSDTTTGVEMSFYRSFGNVFVSYFASSDSSKPIETDFTGGLCYEGLRRDLI